jgi:hypothetical protein
MLYSESVEAYIPRLGTSAMTLLLSAAARSNRSPRIAATGALARAAGSRLPAMGANRPYLRNTFIA